MISVIIPVYNVEQYLEKCIRSIQDNTYKDLEIICVNDGSPDNSLEILRRLAAEDTRIRIIDQKNKGVQTARNNGIADATGEYIAFIDSDDWIHPQYFESLYRCMEENGADLAVCGCQKFNENDDIDVINYPQIHYRRLNEKEFFNSYYARHMCWGRLYRKQNITNIQFEPHVVIGDDTLFNLCVISNIAKPTVYETELPLYFYLQRGNSIVRMATYQSMTGLPDWVLANEEAGRQQEWSWMLTMQAIKMSLAYRYCVMVYKDRSGFEKAGQMLNALERRMLGDRQIHLKNKLVHLIMIHSPALYRQFRLKDDPTLKIWEENVKANRNSQK